MSIVDRSLYFGLQNFSFVNSYIGSSVTGDINEYVIYQDKKGLILIARFNAAGDEGRYCTKVGDYATIVADRGLYNYVIPSLLKDLEI